MSTGRISMEESSSMKKKNHQQSDPPSYDDRSDGGVSPRLRRCLRFRSRRSAMQLLLATCLLLTAHQVVQNNELYQAMLEESSAAMDSSEALSSSDNNTMHSTQIVLKGLSYCQEHNFIADHQDQTIERNANNSRRHFSIRATDVQRQHQDSCSSVTETLDAIRLGTRQWEPQYQNRSLLERESFYSTFIPHGCDVPLNTPAQMCDILNQFSHVVIQGDSLSRHLQGGLLMGLRGDIRRGSLIPKQVKVPLIADIEKRALIADPNSTVRMTDYEKCQCDGQFSEHPTCRDHGPLYYKFQPHELGLCPHLGKEDQFESVFNINRLHKGVYKFPGVDCSDPSSRGVLVVAQGGVHLKYNAASTYRMILRKLLDDPIFQSCALQNKAYLIWTSYQAQSESYHEKYPHQSLNVGIPFNHEMQYFIQHNRIQNLVTMDWLNFTTGAQHSDGLHFAAQVNYLKAQHVVAVANLMKKEGKSIRAPFIKKAPVINCGCPKSCTNDVLSHSAEGVPFSCKERVLFLMKSYNETESSACALAVKQGACGRKCDPMKCRR